MRTPCCCNSLFILAVFAACLVLAEEKGKPSSAVKSDLSEIRVLDVVIAGTNVLQIGKESVLLHAATNKIEQSRENIDVIAIHGDTGLSLTNSTRAATLEKLLSMGIPLIIVEENGDAGEYAWRPQSGEDGIRTVTIGTEQFAAVRRLWRRTQSPSETSAAPVLKTTLDWNTKTDTYEFSRVELGLFGKRVWLMHEQHESNEGSGTVGFQLKKEW